MKLAVSSYSFESLKKKEGITQLDCVKKAKEMGFDGIEIVEIQPHDGSSKEDYAKKIREQADICGIEISNFCIGANFLADNLSEEIKRVMENVNYANILGVKNMRHDIAYVGNDNYIPFEKALPIIADAAREVTQYAKSLNIKTCSENHGFYCQDSERIEAVINAVNDENYRWLGDMGNFLCVDEDPSIGFSRLAPYAIYVHAKDFIYKKANMQNPGNMFFMTRGGNYLRGTIVGHGDVPVKSCINALKRVGYDGYISLEFEGPEYAIDAIKAGKENLERYLKD